ncbi:MAG: asparagine--tRNA ligase [Clostridiales bacterium]|nr:asparagine--tRNA ligase [Candidatus Crickella merdequi]
MKDIEIRELFKNPEQFGGQEIVVRGWVRGNRSSNQFGFISLNDGTFFTPVQVVYEASKLENYEQVSKIRLSAGIMVRGVLELTPEAQQPFEIKADEVVLEADSDPDYPLQKKRHTMEFMREIAHLRPRSNTFSAVFRVRSVAAYAIHQFFQEKGFIYAHSPEITCSDCEGAGEMFQVTTLDLDNLPRDEEGNIDYTKDFFGKKANLTVSGQLEGEIMALAFRNIYTFGPTFRAENSNTARHASEFWMIEPEMSFCELEGNMDIAEEMIKHIINTVLEKCPKEMEFFNKFVDKGLLERLDNIVSNEFGRITYTEAVEILKDSGKDFEYPVEWGVELQTEHERYLTEQVFKKPIFVINYPKDCKAFYMRVNEDNKTVAAMDMLVPGVGEIIGGSQREERYDVLVARIKELGLNVDDYSWYLDLRKYGGVKHSGYGLGFDRILMYMTGMSNIRDVQMFPRTPGNAEF